MYELETVFSERRGLIVLQANEIDLSDVGEQGVCRWSATFTAAIDGHGLLYLIFLFLSSFGLGKSERDPKHIPPLCSLAFLIKHASMLE